MRDYRWPVWRPAHVLEIKLGNACIFNFVEFLIASKNKHTLKFADVEDAGRLIASKNEQTLKFADVGDAGRLS